VATDAAEMVVTALTAGAAAPSTRMRKSRWSEGCPVNAWPASFLRPAADGSPRHVSEDAFGDGLAG
jgi:hypothetical protein